MRGDMPAPVPAGIVETLQQSCDEDGVIHWQAEIKPGQRVQIVEGALAEFVGQLERLDAAGRVRILLNILGRRTPIVLPRESVIPAEDVH